MLLGLPVLLQDLHASEAGDALGEVDDEIPLGQLKETVNGPRFDPPPRQDLPGLFPAEQLVIAEHDHAGLHHAEAGMDFADDQPQPIRLRQLSGRQHFSQPLGFSLVVASDQHAVFRRGAVEFVAHLADLAAERSTDSTRRWQVASTVLAGSAEMLTLGKRTTCWKDPATENRPRVSVTRSR